MLVSTGPAFFSPQAVAAHVCTSGPTWSAIVLPTSDVYSGMCKVDDTYIATGAGQAGATPSNSIRSTLGISGWVAGGTMVNIANQTPFSLRAGAHNNWAIASPSSNCVTCWVTRDKGVSWASFATGCAGGTSCSAIESGNGKFVYLDSVAAFTYSSASGAGVQTDAAPAKLARAWWIASRGLWLCLENGGTRSWTTPDLRTFTAGPTMPYDSASIGPNGIAQNGSNIVIVYQDATSTHAAYSIDNGLTFAASAAFAGGASQSFSVAYGNGLFICTIALGSTTQISSTGATWVAGAPHTTTKTWRIGHDGLNGWFAIGGGSSPDTVGNAASC